MTAKVICIAQARLAKAMKALEDAILAMPPEQRRKCEAAIDRFEAENPKK